MRMREKHSKSQSLQCEVGWQKFAKTRWQMADVDALSPIPTAKRETHEALIMTVIYG